MDINTLNGCLNDIFSDGDLSISQTEFLRTSLTEYLEDSADIGLVRKNSKNRYNVKRFKEIVAETLNIKSPAHETLGDFIYNKNSYNEGQPVYSSIDTKKLLVSFLIEEDWLDLNELINTQECDTQIPRRLSGSLNHSKFDLRNDLITYSGLYKLASKLINYSENYTFIDMSISNDEFFFRVNKISVDNTYGYISETGNSVQQKIVYTAGWGVFLQKNLLLIILYDPREKVSSCYVSSNNSSIINKNVSKIFLFEHDDTDEVEKEKISTKKRKEFEVVVDFSCIKYVTSDTFIKDFEVIDKKIGRKAKRKLSLFRKIRRSSSSINIDVGKNNTKKEIDMTIRTLSEEAQEKLNESLLRAAFDMDTKKVKSALDNGADVNSVYPASKMTAAQIAASCADWPSLTALLETEKCNLLHRSENGWLTSMWAGMYGFTEEATAIRKLERIQGEKIGIVPLIKGDVPLEEHNKYREERRKRFGVSTENENGSTPDIEPGS